MEPILWMTTFSEPVRMTALEFAGPRYATARQTTQSGIDGYEWAGGRHAKCNLMDR